MMMFKRSEKELHSTVKRANKRIKQRCNSSLIEDLQIENLQVIPSEAWALDSLVKLTLTKCSLVAIPKQIEKFSHTLRMNRLTSLDLNHNDIQTLPIEIKFLNSLVTLNISNNQLRMLPSTFSDLRNLTVLSVANNNLSQLPAFKKEDIRLRSLDVSFNPLDGALSGRNTFEVHPSNDEPFGYDENLFSPTTPILKKFPKLFQIALLRIVRYDKLLKLAAEEMLPSSIVSTMQRDIFKCYKCGQMSILPAYNSTDILDYVDQVEVLQTTGNYRHGMTFMKLFCKKCFIPMSN